MDSGQRRENLVLLSFGLILIETESLCSFSCPEAYLDDNRVILATISSFCAHLGLPASVCPGEPRLRPLCLSSEGCAYRKLESHQPAGGRQARAQNLKSA